MMHLHTPKMHAHSWKDVLVEERKKWEPLRRKTSVFLLSNSEVSCHMTKSQGLYNSRQLFVLSSFMGFL